MQHFKLLSSESRDLTPALAVEFSTMKASVTERDLKKSRMDYLRESILGGTAISFHWARAKVIAEDTIYRVNGHHSSKVAAEMDGNLPEGLKVHLDDYEVADANG